MCDHLFETTTRYDKQRRLLTFLLVCPVCRRERGLETVDYEPHFSAAQVDPALARVR
jgi:hypothetical protein